MIELILKLMDFILKIKKPERYEPSKPVQVSESVDDALFLNMKYTQDFYREVNADMRAFRDWEFKMVSLYFQVSSFFFAGNIILMVSAASGLNMLRFCVGLISIVFLLAFWFKLHSRIAHDNNSYAFNMSHRRYIERKWFGNEYPKPPAHVSKSATGPGYRKMQALVAISAIAACSVLIVGLIHSFPFTF